jgi:hypothetical protein
MYGKITLKFSQSLALGVHAMKASIFAKAWAKFRDLLRP